MADLFAPPTKEEMRQRRRKRFFDDLKSLNKLIHGLKYLNLESIDGLKILVRTIKYDYIEISDQEDIKKLWEGSLSQIISRLNLLSDTLKKKYNDQIAELNKNAEFVTLVKEVEQAANELNSEISCDPPRM